jgi:glycosyltransferase involved in cell wall biosynthesis
MRVALVSSKYPPEYSGSGLRAHDTYLRLRRDQGVEFEVITGTSLTDESTRYELDEVNVSSFAISTEKLSPGRNGLLRHISLASLNLKVWNRLRSIQPDVIHLFGKNAVTAAAATYANARQIPIIAEFVNVSSSPDQSRPFYLRWLFGSGYGSNSIIVCISPHMGEIAEKVGYSPERLWVRPNPVDLERYMPDGESKVSQRSSLTKFGADDVVLLNIGKFMPLKNQIFLLDVLSMLPPNYKLVLAGPLETEGPDAARDQAYFESIEDKMHEMDIVERVQIIKGFIDEPPTLMNCADVYLLPSTTEAFGTPAAEATAMDLPVIATDLHDVFGEIVKDGVNGALLPHDPALWAENVLGVVQSPSGAFRSHVDKIREYVSSERIDDAYWKMLEKILAD